MPEADAKNLFRPLAKQWKSAIRLASEQKNKLFGKDAEDCMQLYTGDMDMWGTDETKTTLTPGLLEGGSPAFKYVYCIAAELVQVFGPAMYFRNPHRQVNPTEPLKLDPELFVDPVMQFQAQQMQQQLQQLQGQGQQQGQDPNQPPQPPDMQLQMAMAGLGAQLQQIQQTLQGQQQEFQLLNLKEQARYSQNKMRAQLLQRYLNYTPNELDLKQHSRDCIDEALIKGAGMLLTELYQPPDSDMILAGSFYRSINDLQLDPDASRDDEVMWAAIRCIEPIWEVARTRKIPKKLLKGSMESGNHQASTAQDEFKGKYDRRKGYSNDLIRYWKVYSKMGMGNRLKTAAERETQGSPMYEDYRKQTNPLFESFGDYCYIEVADGIPFPLNMRPGSEQNPEKLKEKVQWPIPFWKDGEWPFTVLQFHKIPGQIWPMSHLRPAMAEIKFIQWCMSFLAQRVKNSCEDIVACAKAAGEDIKKALTAASSHAGFRFVALEQAMGKSIKDIVSVFSFPQVNGDIWMMIAAVAEKLEKRLGLTELAYGMSARQYRSAEEAQTKQQNFSIRPDDMTQTVEEFQTRISRKEALTISYHGDPQLDIKPILGETGAALWERLISKMPTNELMRELYYRIEANSAKKPNQDRDAANIQQAMQYLLQMFEQIYLNSGNAKPYNALIERWCAATDTKTDGLLLEDQPPKPNPEEQKIQLEMQQSQQQMQMDQQKMQADISLLMQTAQIEQQQGEQELALEREKFHQEMAMKAGEHALDMRTKLQTAALDLQTMRAKSTEQQRQAKIKTEQAKKQAAAKPVGASK